MLGTVTQWATTFILGVSQDLDLKDVKKPNYRELTEFQRAEEIICYPNFNQRVLTQSKLIWDDSKPYLLVYLKAFQSLIWRE